MALDKKSQFPLFSKILNGGIAGIVGVSIVYPIDLVKTRLQNQNSSTGEKQYKNMLDCFKKSYKASGYLGMYRGSAVNILLVTPEKAIKLTANDAFRYILLDKQGKLTLPREMIAGGTAGLCQTVITTPMELLKIKMQLSAQQSTSGPRASALRLALELISSQGLRGLYRGCLSTIMRDVSFSIIYFPLFAHLKSLGSHQQGTDLVTCDAPFYWSFISGCAAGGFAAVAVNPIDVVKTRLQAQGQSKEIPGGGKGTPGPSSVLMKPHTQSRDTHQLAFLNASGEAKGGGVARSLHQPSGAVPGAEVPRYHGMGDAVVRIFREEGFRAFFKGGGCRVLVIAPLFGIAQTVYYLGVGEYLLGVNTPK